jgi:DNA-binding transcriptional MerR regulator
MTMLDPGGFELPPIPTKRYFTIGEVSKLCEVKPHVLRYWEQEFPQLKPVKRRGNRRYYQRHEVKLIRHIRKLLYVEGFTISGARIRLEQLTAENETTTTTTSPVVASQDTSKMVSLLIAELSEVQEILS